MGVREHVSRSKVSPAHLVQFFDSDDTRHEAVAGFLAEGYHSGSALVLIARPANTAAILDRLDEAGARTQRAIDCGRLTVLDATDTLRRTSRLGSPDAGRFGGVVGTVVTSMSRQGRVCAYAEMVDILAQRGDFGDAMVVEDLWNHLAGRFDLSVICGYAAAHFVSASAQNALRDVCGAHASVRVEPQDPLAAWLLQQAQ